MKYIHYIAAIISLGFLASRAEAKLGSFVVNLTVTQQSLVEAESSRTNITATSTNVTTVTQSTTTNTVINNAKLLKMLANSFNTNFPANATLRLDVGGAVVAVGTNVILNVNSVLTLNPTGATSLQAATATQAEKHTHTVNATTLRVSGLITSLGTLTYDDSSRTTADGTTTKFTVTGFTTAREALSLSTINTVSKATISVASTVTGAGVGIISGKEAVIRGFAADSLIVTGL